MNLEDLKNLDVKDLIEKIKSGSGPSLFKDKKALTKFAIGFVAVLIFLIFYYAFVAPKVNAQKEKINIMKDNQNKIAEYTSNIGNWGGNAIFDDCGVCDGNNLDKDCFGICFGALEIEIESDGLS